MSPFYFVGALFALFGQSNSQSTVSECLESSSGYEIEYLGESNPENDKYCYTYLFSRSPSNWFCDNNGDQAWNRLYLDPCGNLDNGDTDTLSTLNNALFDFDQTSGAVFVKYTLASTYTVSSLFFYTDLEVL